jgi:hypothetical protein
VSKFISIIRFFKCIRMLRCTITNRFSVAFLDSFSMIMSMPFSKLKMLSLKTCQMKASSSKPKFLPKKTYKTLKLMTLQPN